LVNAENINKLMLRPKVLLAPLDWGLGHATRCIPIINVLIEHDIEVILAAEGAVARLLKEEYPSIVILPLNGYNIKYSRGRRSFSLKMLIQLPRLLSSISQEKKWLNKIIDIHNINAVISDNRFGLSNVKAPCVYITHQLFIQTGNSFLNKVAQKVNYYFINKFTECWVPDTGGINNLAGKLSHPVHFPRTRVKYLGILSRCRKINTEKKYSLLVLLSGPEPQRTIFENILLKQLDTINGTIVFVRGLPGTNKKIQLENKNIIIHDHLPAEQLNELLQQAENIIARSGYSTIMDLVTVQQKAILVATPGQTEQEYLATHLMEQKLFYACRQEGFNLEQHLKEKERFGFTLSYKTAALQKDIITEWADKLKTEFMAVQ